jgi:hypothetical protein
MPRQLDDKGDVLPGTGIGQVDFTYPSPSKTVLTNSLGQKTVFTHTVIGQENRLLEVGGLYRLWHAESALWLR